MLSALNRMIERQLRRAEAEGKLSGLKGEGAPLPDRPVGEDAGLSAAMRMAAEAGVVPEEFTLQKELDAARAALAQTESPEDRRTLQTRIAELEMRRNMAREARRSFFR
ncbi:DUF1992 domain-containing protein [Aliishimia ponticola]|uniref:DUF1992 domain-containing protein n=1 Tax=Aliishimia ponticola TaxID=2499833 RepID=A0A4S4ND15_9RHOB|nr:DnaJ family domain-containing protein [Aliishimia ponticola]THH37352.1 DUF1992 domain-containing protein [Aliishimia ponticola]